MMPRLCVEDSVVEGVEVPAGMRVFLCFGAANHDPAVFELELERVWYRTWVYVGHESEVPSIHDYVAKSIARQPKIGRASCRERVCLYV